MSRGGGDELQALVNYYARGGYSRHVQTACAGGGDVARFARRSRDRAASSLINFKARFSRERREPVFRAAEATRIGRAAAPATVMGWAGRKVTASATGGDRR